MKSKERIFHITARLEPTDIFADIGCDHGLMTKYMLDNNLCRRAYITDISEKSLQKAVTLLAPYVKEGKCIPVVGDGLAVVPEPCDFVLIAGLGGEAILNMIEDAYMPPRFLFQPMTRAYRLREYLLENGANLELDYTFSEGLPRKYYDIILGTGYGGDRYSALDILFGRDNLNGRFPHPFLEKAQEELDYVNMRLSRRLPSKLSLHHYQHRREELMEAIYAVKKSL